MSTTKRENLEIIYFLLYAELIASPVAVYSFALKYFVNVVYVLSCFQLTNIYLVLLLTANIYYVAATFLSTLPVFLSLTLHINPMRKVIL